MNTLFRKAIENNYVHPIYIHGTSSRFGAQIEEAETIDALNELFAAMIKSYCALVRDCSLADLSPPVRKAVLFIDLNLGSTFSTREIARDQFISPNYLSARFKAETGKRITDYILERRIAMACRLLSEANSSVQMAASSVGIPDASYFSKQFKRITGFSPLQYRNHCLRR